MFHLHLELEKRLELDERSRKLCHTHCQEAKNIEYQDQRMWFSGLYWVLAPPLPPHAIFLQPRVRFLFESSHRLRLWQFLSSFHQLIYSTLFSSRWTATSILTGESQEGVGSVCRESRIFSNHRSLSVRHLSHCFSVPWPGYSGDSIVALIEPPGNIFWIRSGKPKLICLLYFSSDAGQYWLLVTLIVSTSPRALAVCDWQILAWSSVMQSLMLA